MKRLLRPRTLIQLGIFLLFVAVLAKLFSGPLSQNFASIAYPPIPDEHYQYITDAAKHCGVPADQRGLIAAVAWKESTFHPGSQSGAGAVGVMQVLRGTGLGTANEYQIGGLNAATFTDPAIGYKLGTCYLHSLVTRLGEGKSDIWNDDAVIKSALIGYNAGPARGASYLSGGYNGPISSLGYADRIMQARQVYTFDFARWDQRQANGQSSVDVLGQIRDLVFNVLLKPAVNQ